MRPAAVLLLLLLGSCTRPEPPAKAPAAGVELSRVMLELQIHQNKLWFAGAAENWDLVRFYLDKIQEDYEPVIGAGIMVGSTDVSAIMATTLPPLVDAARTAAADRDAAAFSARYLDLVQGCNSCHRSAGQGFIVIQRPAQPFMDNQKF
ncbi:MAG TPA: hypothetical protein VGF40_17260 [Thermoanaerobaculia bacterium]